MPGGIVHLLHVSLRPEHFDLFLRPSDSPKPQNTTGSWGAASGVVPSASRLILIAVTQKRGDD